MPLKLDVDQAAASYLDYSKLVVNSKDELIKVLNKLPDYRTRPEKVKVEELKIMESHFTFGVTKQELQQKDYGFPNPIPVVMQKVPLNDIASVDINWHMLTMARPTVKFDEEYFNRIVYLERNRYKSIIKEAEQAAKANAKANKESGSKKSRRGGSRSSSQKVGAVMTEGRHQTCKECGEEFCSGICQEYLYEIHARLPPVDEDEDTQQQQPLENLPKDTKKENSKKSKNKIVKKITKKKDKEEKKNSNKETEKTDDNKKPPQSPNPPRKKSPKKSPRRIKPVSNDEEMPKSLLEPSDFLTVESGSTTPKSIRSVSSPKVRAKKSPSIKANKIKSPRLSKKVSKSTISAPPSPKNSTVTPPDLQVTEAEK